MPSPHRFPPPLVDRGSQEALFHRQGRERSGARLRLFRGRAGVALERRILLTHDEAWRIAANIAKLQDCCAGRTMRLIWTRPEVFAQPE